jgi:hypothetical protein
MRSYVNTVPKGFAQIGQYPANKLPPGAGATGPSNMYFHSDTQLAISAGRNKKNSKEPSSFFLVDGLASALKEAAEFQDNFRKIVDGEIYPAFRYRICQVSTLPATASNNDALAGTAASNARFILGFRGFICEKCGFHEIVPFDLSKEGQETWDISRMFAGLAKQVGMATRSHVELLSHEMTTLMKSTIDDLTGSVPFLYSLNAHASSPIPDVGESCGFWRINKESLHIQSSV